MTGLHFAYSCLLMFFLKYWRATASDRPASALVAVTLDDVTIQPTRAEVKSTDENDAMFLLQYQRPEAGRLVVDAAHLAIMGEGYTSTFTFTQNGEIMAGGLRVLRVADRTAQVHIAPTTSSPQQQARDNGFSTFKQFFILGFEHILEGLDHLLFLAGVLIVCRGARRFWFW